MSAPIPPANVPIAWQISTLEQELAHKRASFPVLINRGRMRPEKAEQVLRDLTAALATLRRLAATDPLATPHGARPPQPPPHYAV